jgi:hypothetical protein
VNKVVPNALEFVTSLYNGNVVGRLVGTDQWRLFDPLGNTLATRTLDNLGTFVGAAPTGLAAAPLPGDFNIDGKVNQVDLGIWSGHFGQTAATFGIGDANGDQVVDGEDFLIWQRYVTPATASPNVGGVPEPSSCVLAALGSLAGACNSIRRARRFVLVP